MQKFLSGASIFWVIRGILSGPAKNGHFSKIVTFDPSKLFERGFFPNMVSEHGENDSEKFSPQKNFIFVGKLNFFEN